MRGRVCHVRTGAPYLPTRLRGPAVPPVENATALTHSFNDLTNYRSVNALAESFFSAIKNEWLHHFVFTTRAKAKR